VAGAKCTIFGTGTSQGLGELSNQVHGNTFPSMLRNLERLEQPWEALSRSFGALTHILMCHIVFDVRLDGRPPIMAENEV
jgi:hypothetical protein